MPMKHFTVEEANRSLTLVTPIVGDILRKMHEAQILHNEVKMEKIKPDISEVSLLDKLRRAEKLLNEVEYNMKELESVGAIFRDFSVGVIDFPCMYMGRLVYLCWMKGEKSVKMWHEAGESFSQRKVVDESFNLVVA